jgi:hypothetical protein
LIALIVDAVGVRRAGARRAGDPSAVHCAPPIVGSRPLSTRNSTLASTRRSTSPAAIASRSQSACRCVSLEDHALEVDLAHQHASPASVLCRSGP